MYSPTPPSSPGGEWTETTLYSFHGSDGSAPNGGVVIGPDGVLYGTTASGGAGTSCSGGCGTVFALKPPAASLSGDWTETVLHSFDFTDGASPNAGVTNR